MSFHTSAQNIRVEENHILRASLSNDDGEFVEAEIDLNGFIGNNNGTVQLRPILIFGLNHGCV